MTTQLALPKDLTIDTAFDSLDLDSLVLIELAVILKKQHGVEVVGDELATAGTVARVAELMTEKVANA